MRLWKDTRQKATMTDWQKVNLAKNNMVKISERVSGDLLMAGITRPIIMGVILNGTKTINKAARLTAFLFLNYLVVMKGRRVVSAVYWEGVIA
jgi:hypothetical protein